MNGHVAQEVVLEDPCLSWRRAVHNVTKAGRCGAECGDGCTLCLLVHASRADVARICKCLAHGANVKARSVFRQFTPMRWLIEYYVTRLPRALTYDAARKLHTRVLCCAHLLRRVGADETTCGWDGYAPLSVLTQALRTQLSYRNVITAHIADKAEFCAREEELDVILSTHTNPIYKFLCQH